ncbi:hypothetical protein A2697_02075 [Candidatus Curtissbacteria bacterium RIFCSPHIGHO2_01_FULL_41_44]|uniref:5'-deoxynucleotidase n=1 Tax=Candidatus Curtissbacteria bacterium RIFCSPLOWO2_01_FULL_42_50 TaxID=1797730 RepID=A0A1F5H3I5_9BACT|nr:MAG: hypothetical protein A2697_02075 [Candidatus Curtissbacteria bacterium RIFCSPHIGHO2_01_FULL_41_44]OGD94646.1 MAG: hypothetical protein A3C33_01225 [Candidatus Curtissbacteria bacterium RIFCSPHIGHO2_02_FULL_42_58]OGD96842.1 MAG: hypothetical protein A3E71_03015 [Candidatus Curtissbacteria bacterium RIFCSPHIGHO2_12_FULL_42_33]OGD98730.1 MAG: hypothetical protein A3B54_04785 [Candidatus Curtissbacteria bacterium RIFCSPLOWO2_01_FULL_42_50]OGE02231.1 MAG: hypothetical protein A3G16_01090 [Ca
MSLIKFLKIVGKLKKVKRTGWLVAGIKNPESVAEHSYRLAVLSMVLGKKFNLNTEKLIKMSLIHDLAEGEVGDLVLERGQKQVMSPKKKLKLEKDVLKKIFGELDDKDQYLTLWQETQELKTPEARILKQLDKLEMIMQALEYEGEVNPKNLDEFWTNARKYLKNPKLLLFLEELSNLRNQKRSQNR